MTILFYKNRDESPFFHPISYVRSAFSTRRIDSNRAESCLLGQSLRDSARVFWGPMGVPSPVWGPLRGTETKRVGAHAAVVSMVVTPTIPSALVQHLNDEVLLKVRPHPDDTARTLQERIARKSFFDDFRVLQVKGGSKYVHLNRTGMSQTRRVTFSEPLSAPYRDDDGDLVQDLLMYPHSYRHPDDNMCRPMTGAVKQLRDVLFAHAEPFLTQRCRQAGEPNSAEVMGYYGLFNSATGAPCEFNSATGAPSRRVQRTRTRCLLSLLLRNRCIRAGRHRDGFSAPELDAYYCFGDNPFTTDPFCQMRNTNTLIFTMGDQAMEMPLSFPLDKCDAGNTREYRTHPLLTIPLLNGTLLIYAPLG